MSAKACYRQGYRAVQYVMTTKGPVRASHRRPSSGGVCNCGHWKLGAPTVCDSHLEGWSMHEVANLCRLGTASGFENERIASSNIRGYGWRLHRLKWTGMEQQGGVTAAGGWFSTLFSVLFLFYVLGFAL